MARVLGAARGLCSSPLSSADEAEGEIQSAADEVFAFNPDAPVRKRKASGGTQETSGKKGGRKAARRADDAHPTSAHDLIAGAPQTMVEFLAEQLGVRQQAQLAKKFGAGQGFMVEVPAAGKRRKVRQDTLEWLHALGFSSGVTLPRNVLRISSLKADVIVRELHRRVLPNADGDEKHQVGAAAGLSEPLETGEDGDDQQADDDEDAAVVVDIANDPSIQSWKEYYNKLDEQELEVVSFAEHNRLLSSARHMEIADAMEDMLAQPSLRKDRSRARRLSKLERISGRRFSVLPRMSSIAPILEDERESGDDEAIEIPPVFLSPIKRTRVSLAEAKLSAKKLSTKKKNPFGEKILRLVLHAGFIPPETIKTAICRVSLSWRRIGIAAYAWAVADYSKQRRGMRPMAEVYRHHPRGHYLADGAYKEVFKVFSEQKKRLEVVSVMNITGIESTGNQVVVQQEIAHSVLLSHLVETGACPNFLRIFDIYLAPEKPQEERWGSAQRRKPVELLTEKFQSIRVSSANEAKHEEAAAGDSLYQYIEMEYCDGGDVEDFISLQKDKLLPAESVAVPFFFQMVFALYCAREQLHLRHCDVKLLNFFLKDTKGNLGGTKAHEEKETVIHYVIEQRCFQLRLPPAFSYWVKLADYGSADSSAENIGKPVTLDQFTTLENTPIEFLLEGDAVKQSFAADTFSLGLCLLHLFTGCAPYEETLESVKCPAALLQDLKAIWTDPRKSSGFTVLKRVVQDDPEDSMYHTLYRFLVLFGLPSENPSEGKRISKVWDVLLKHLRPEDAKPAKRSSRRLASTLASGRSSPESSVVKEQFERHSAEFSIATGSNPIIARGRQRLQSVRGAFDLLKTLVAFNPAQRPTLKQVFGHPMFERLRAPPTNSTAPDFVVDCYKIAEADRVVIPDV